MRIVYMGTPDFAVPPLCALQDAGHEVIGVFTQPDKPQGRKMQLVPPPVKTLALAAGIPVYQPESLKDGACETIFTQLNPDVIVVVAYGKILPAYVLGCPRYGCINVHGSLLPRWRGAAPIQWSVIAGDKVAGITTMQIDAGLDTGDILLHYETPVGQRETAGQLYDRLSQAGAELLLETLRQMEQGALQPRKQDDAASSYAPLLNKEIARIDWKKTAHEIDCLIRGLNPWPIALTTLEDTRIKVFSAEPVSGTGIPGTILCADTKLIAACGDGALSLTEIQAVGGKRMLSSEYLRGHKVAVGIVLGSA